MRPIKFRGKRIDNGEWVYGLLIYGFCCGTEWHRYLAIQTETHGEEFGVIPETVGQFTGLCDKNGKEIYEGDIVIPSCCDRTCPHIVKWEDFRWTLSGFVSGYEFTGRDEVIGNIHEHNYLLDTKTEK